MGVPLISFLTFLVFTFLALAFRQKKTAKSESLMSNIKKKDVDDYLLAMAEDEKKKTGKLSFIDKRKVELEQSGLKMSHQHYIAYTAISGGVGYMIGMFVFSVPLLAFCCAGLGLAVPMMYVRSVKKRLMSNFSTQLRQAMIRMGSAVRAGSTLKQAIYEIARNDETPDLIRREFQQAHTDIEFGLTPSQAFENMYERTQSVDVRTLAIITEIQQEKGGNLLEMIDSIQIAITNRHNQTKKIIAMISSQRAQANLISGLPFVMYFVMNLISPEYYENFLATQSGQMIVIGCFAVILVGNVVIRKISDIS